MICPIFLKFEGGSGLATPEPMWKLGGLVLAGLVALAGCTPFAGDPSSDTQPDTDTKPVKHAVPTEDASDVGADVDTSTLDPFFAAQMKSGNIPGLGVAVVGDGKIKWSKGYGVADLETEKPVDRDTLFLLSGTSTAVTAAAFMQLVENGAVSLDADAGSVIGFPLRNPSFAGTPITFRMLLTHTSGLRELDVAHSTGDSATPLATWVKSKTSDGGAWKSNAPGAKYEYASVNLAVVGLAIEALTGQNLQAYVQAHVFAPLAMNESSFFLDGLDRTHIARPYQGPQLEPQGLFGVPDYPSEQLRTSAPQLARFLLMLTGKGTLAKTKVLSPSSVTALLSAQVPDVDADLGLAFYKDVRGGRSVIGLDGYDRGAHTEMFFDPTTNEGYVVLLNADAATDGGAFTAALGNITDKLMDLAVRLP